MLTEVVKRLWNNIYIKLTVIVVLILAVTLSVVSVYISHAVTAEVSGFSREYETVKLARLTQLINASIENNDLAGLESIIDTAGVLEGWNVGLTSDGTRLPVPLTGERLPLINGISVFSGDWYANSPFGDSSPPVAAPTEPVNWYLISDEVNRRLLWTGLIAGIAGILLLIWLVRRMLRPVEVVVSAADKLGEGDLSQRIEVSGHSEISRLGATFNTMAARLEAGEKQRRKLMADIAHELRTPVFNIRGYLEGIQDGTFSPDAETIDTMHRQVVQLTNLVEDVKTVTLAESGGFHLDKHPVSIGDLVRACAVGYKALADRKHVDLSTEIAVTIPEVSLDETRISQVLDNLFRNALFHTPSDGKITISATQAAPQRIRVTVSDTGEGIAESDLEQVFERFYKTDKSRTADERGSGLGLTIARELVAAHGGIIWVESKPGKGASFIFELPV